MRRILKTKEMRQIKIVELLYFSSNHKVSEKTLLEKIDANERTLKDDIREINQSFDYLNIFSLQNDNYKIVLDDTFTIDSVYRDVFRNGLSFKIMEYLFFNGELHNEDAEIALYTSASTVYRTVTKLIPVLEADFGISIDSSPYKVVGDESNIRYFYKKFFLEAYPLFEWPFFDIDQEKINSICNFFLDLVERSNDVYDLRQFSYEAAINIMRSIQGNGYLIDNSQIEQLLAFYKKENPAIFDDFYDKFQIDLTEEFIANFASIYADSDYHYNFPGWENTKHIADNPHDKAAYDYLNGFIDELCDEFNLKLNDKSNFILEISNVVSAEYRTKKKTYILYSPFKTFDSQMADEFPLFHERVKDGVHRYLLLLLGDYPEDLLSATIYAFYIYWDGLFNDLHKHEPTTKILILSDYHRKHAEMIGDILTKTFNSPIDIHYWQANTLSIKQLTDYDCDLIISGFSIEQNIPNKVVYCLKSVPSNEDIACLRMIIEKIKADKIS